MTKVSPSILSCDFSNFQNELEKIEKTSCEYIHIDVMDGHFVNNITFGYELISSLRKHSSKVFDVHLMMMHPEKYLKRFVESGSDIITIHSEIETNVIEVLKNIRSLGVKASIAFNPNTSINNIEKYFPYVDQILLMSVFPGFAGQSFISNTLKRGKEVKDKIKNSLFQKIDLQIDGGVNNTNAKVIRESGFNILVSGSFILKSNDLENAINQLRN